MGYFQASVGSIWIFSFHFLANPVHCHQIVALLFSFGFLLSCHLFLLIVLIKSGIKTEKEKWRGERERERERGGCLKCMVVAPECASSLASFEEGCVMR